MVMGLYKNEVRLNRTAAVCRLLARVINRLMVHDLDVSTARAIIYGSAVLLNGLQQSDLESRILALEQGQGIVTEKDGDNGEQFSETD